MNPPLRILMVADVMPNRDSGVAGTEIALADALVAQGHEVVRVWADRFPHRIRHWNLYHLLEQPGEMRRIVRDEVGGNGPFDVYHVNQPAGWQAARSKRRSGAQGVFVHRSHGFEPRIAAVVRRWQRVYPEDRRPALRRLATRLLGSFLARNHRGILRWADAHVVSCRECADDLSRRGVERDRIHVSGQAATSDLLSTPAAPWTAGRASHLLHIGQHAFFKAPMLVGEVFVRWLAADASRRATWVCEAAAHADVRARLGDSAGRVRLLPWLPREELLRVYDEAGLFLFPSFAEGFGKVFLEAMARGLCVVATDQGGARDLVTSGVDGVLAPVGDGEALARGAELVARSPDGGAAMGERARSTAARYTWERAAAELAYFYAGCLAAGWVK